MFVSELNDKNCRRGGIHAEEEGAAQWQATGAGGGARSCALERTRARGLATTPQLPAFLTQNSTFKEPPPQPQEDHTGSGRYKVKTFGGWIRHRLGRKPLERYPAYYKAKCISKYERS